jgi:coproporphyrinogen III oxidase-like Fe-S oxidoreductase
MATDAPAEVRKLRSRAAAFDDAYASLGRLGVPDVLPALHAIGLSISRTVLGGSHSVAVYPPIDSLMPVDANHVLDAIRFGRDTSLYVHVPFCETRCTFCHYAVQQYANRGSASQTSRRDVARHLEALERELAFWGNRLARSGTALSSIYIGGGTPLVLDQDALDDIIRAIDDGYEILPGAEVCIEGSPLTITAVDGEDKLRFLEARGFTRLSFGVQSFDDAVLRYAARGYKRDVAIRAAEIVSGIFDNWNLDLIQGLYKGSAAETWQNLEVIAELQPPHLTWYHGRFADRPQGDWYKSDDRHGGFEDESATLLGRMLIWEGMAALGYQQTDGNRFVRERLFTDPFKKVRTSSSRDLLGVGAASYSHVGADPAADGDCRGYVFRNETRIRAYAERALSGDVPIATGRVVDDEELLAMSYATGLRNGRTETAALRAVAARKPQLSAHYRALVGMLRGSGILEPHANGDGEDGLRLTELGRLFEDETLALFFSPAVKRAMTARGRSDARLPPSNGRV